MAVFSKRHRRALASGEIEVSLDGRLRGRLWRVMGKFNQSWSHTPYPGDSWTETTDDFEQATSTLLDVRGESRLRVNGRQAAIQEWVMTGGPDAGVLDFLELFYLQIEESGRPALIADINRVLGEEDAVWRMLDGDVMQQCTLASGISRSRSSTSPSRISQQALTPPPEGPTEGPNGPEICGSQRLYAELCPKDLRRIPALQSQMWPC